MRKLKRKGKSLEKLKVYADQRILKLYNYLWALVGCSTTINFVLQIPVDYSFDDKEKDSTGKLITKSIQLTAFFIYYTAIVCMDILIMATFLRFGKQLDVSIAKQAPQLLTKSQGKISHSDVDLVSEETNLSYNEQRRRQQRRLEAYREMANLQIEVL